MEAEYGKGLFVLDPTTGEADITAQARGKVPQDARIAASERIGNITMVAYLREVIGRNLARKPN